MNKNLLKPLPKEFYARPALAVAKDLLNQFVVHQVGNDVFVGKIVETEAYTEDDPACHAYRNYLKLKAGKKIAGRSALLFAEPGVAYIYLNYGIHWLLNVVTDPNGKAGAVLIRAVEPIGGFREAGKLLLTNGPGKLTNAMRIDQSYNGMPVYKRGALWFARNPDLSTGHKVVSSPRIGITKATDREWRFYLRDHPYVSKSKFTQAQI